MMKVQEAATGSSNRVWDAIYFEGQDLPYVRKYPDCYMLDIGNDEPIMLFEGDYILIYKDKRIKVPGRFFKERFRAYNPN